MGENKSAWRKNGHTATFTNTNSTSSTTALKSGLGSEKRARNHMIYVCDVPLDVYQVME